MYVTLDICFGVLQVQAYILAYAQHFGLLRLVRFNSRVGWYS